MRFSEGPDVATPMLVWNQPIGDFKIEPEEAVGVIFAGPLESEDEVRDDAACEFGLRSNQIYLRPVWPPPMPDDWRKRVLTDSTFPPKGTFNREDPFEIAEIMARPEISPLGIESGVKMIRYFINRAGRNLDQAQREILEEAVEILRTYPEPQHPMKQYSELPHGAYFIFVFKRRLYIKLNDIEYVESVVGAKPQMMKGNPFVYYAK